MATFLDAGAVGQRRVLQDVQPTSRAAARSKVALSMYTDLPDGEIAIEEFERFAMDRLRGGGPSWRGCGCLRARLQELFRRDEPLAGWDRALLGMSGLRGRKQFTLRCPRVILVPQCSRGLTT